VHFVGLFFVFIIENARSKKQNRIIIIIIIIIINPILISAQAESMVLRTTANNRNNNNSDSSSNNIILLTMATTHAWTKAQIRTASMNVLSSCTTSSSLKDSSVSEAASSRSTNDLFFRFPETAHFTLDDSAVDLALIKQCRYPFQIFC